MSRSAHYITTARLRWTGTLTEIFNPIYSGIAADGETPSLALRSHLSDNSGSLQELLDQSRRHDEIVG